jgi:hypothetical protein
VVEVSTASNPSLYSGFWTGVSFNHADLQFNAIGGPERILLTWRVEVANGTTNYLIQRSNFLAGAYTTIATVPATGAGAYSHLDSPVTGGGTRFYQLIEQSAAGQTPGGSASAKPYSLALPANMVRVGPNGAYSNIGSAVAAGLGQAHWTITIQPGTYDAFTVDGSSPQHLKIIGDETGLVNIDTTNRPLRIIGRTAGKTVELSGLTIGSPNSPNEAYIPHISVAI